MENASLVGLVRTASVIVRAFRMVITNLVWAAMFTLHALVAVSMKTGLALPTLCGVTPARCATGHPPPAKKKVTIQKRHLKFVFAK